MELQLHNLNIRLLEYKQIMWTCLSTRDSEEIHNEILSERYRCAMPEDVALVMSESLWIRWCKNDRLTKKFRSCSVSDYSARGVEGVWFAARPDDAVVVMTDGRMNKDDRTISSMSFAFVHISQVKYPRQYDSKLKKKTT